MAMHDVTAQVEGVPSTGAYVHIQNDLRALLVNHKVPGFVCDTLDELQLTKEEIISYTEQELIDLSNHLNLNIVIRKRFLNAIKSLPNSAASSNLSNKSIVKVFLTNEDKQQMDEFKTMRKNMQGSLSTVSNELKECENYFQDIENQVSDIYDKIKVMIEATMQNDLKKIRDSKSTIIDNTNEYVRQCEEYLVKIRQYEVEFGEYLSKKSHNNNNDGVIGQSEMNLELRTCVQGYSKIINKYPSIKHQHQKKQNFQLNYDENTLKSTLNNLVTLGDIHVLESKTNKNDSDNDNDNKSDNVNDVEVDDSNYNDNNNVTSCPFSTEFISLPDGAALSNDRMYLNKPNRGHHYAMIESSGGYYKSENINGNDSSMHCWRIYVKYGLDGSGEEKWFLLGIAEYGVQVMRAYSHSTTWGVTGNGSFVNRSATQYRKKGKVYNDNDVNFIYSKNINQVDMLVDFDEGAIGYKVVDDENDMQFIIDGFDTNKKWIPIFDSHYKGGKLQVAKIPIKMYGINANLVNWSVRY